MVSPRPGESYATYTLAVPTYIAEDIPEGSEFRAYRLPPIYIPAEEDVQDELTGVIEGIIYIPTKPLPGHIPVWAPLIRDRPIIKRRAKPVKRRKRPQKPSGT